MEGRWALRWWTTARNDTAGLIDLASPNHGIVGAGACAGSGNCWPAVWQMASRSHFLKALNSVSETPGSVASAFAAHPGVRSEPPLKWYAQPLRMTGG